MAALQVGGWAPMVSGTQGCRDCGDSAAAGGGGGFGGGCKASGSLSPLIHSLLEHSLHLYSKWAELPTATYFNSPSQGRQLPAVVKVGNLPQGTG